MKRIILTILLVFQYSAAFSQFEADSNESNRTTQARNAIFVELVGSGGIYSINYERVVSDNMTFRSGLSYIHGDGFLFGKLLTIPLSTSYLISTDKDSHIELGAGNTFILHDGEFMNAIGPVLALREQDLLKGGPYARLSFTPFLIFTGKEVEIVPIWGGVSFGTSF